MRLRRRGQHSPTRRQKLQAEDLIKPPGNFTAYRARRFEEERGGGRQSNPDMILPQPQPESRGHQRLETGRYWLQRAGLIILSLAALASVVNVLSLSTDAKVVPLPGADNTSSLLHAPSVYETAANQQLSHSVWSLNKITVNTAGLSKALLQQFPELKTVNVTVPLLAHRPVVYIQAAQPALVLVTSSNAFIVDNTGKALIGGTSPASFSRAKLPVLNDLSGLRIQTDRQALPANNVNFIQTVIAELAAKKFTVSAMTLPAASSELDVQLAGQPYFVKFNLQNNNGREQAGTFLATVTQLQRQNIKPGHYVDVRVNGRAYYQ